MRDVRGQVALLTGAGGVIHGAPTAEAEDRLAHGETKMLRDGDRRHRLAIVEQPEARHAVGDALFLFEGRTEVVRVVPRPRPRETRPPAARCCTACRTVGRLTPKYEAQAVSLRSARPVTAA